MRDVRRCRDGRKTDANRVAHRRPVALSEAIRITEHRTDARVIEEYSWVSHGDLFTLRADAIKTDDAWMGNFQLGRCRSEDVSDTWQIGKDHSLRVLRADVEGSANDRVLWFEYVTACLLEDRSCHARELDQLWPTLQSRADRQQVTAIQISAENCVGASVSFRVDRALDGQWKGGIWSPGEK